MMTNSGTCTTDGGMTHLDDLFDGTGCCVSVHGCPVPSSGCCVSVHGCPVPSSRSTVKLDLCGLQFFCQHVLERDWQWVKMIRAPKIRSLPDIPSSAEFERLRRQTLPEIDRYGLRLVSCSALLGGVRSICASVDRDMPGVHSTHPQPVDVKTDSRGPVAQPCRRTFHNYTDCRRKPGSRARFARQVATVRRGRRLPQREYTRRGCQCS